MICYGIHRTMGGGESRDESGQVNGGSDDLACLHLQSMWARLGQCHRRLGTTACNSCCSQWGAQSGEELLASLHPPHSTFGYSCRIPCQSANTLGCSLVLASQWRRVFAPSLTGPRGFRAVPVGSPHPADPALAVCVARHFPTPSGLTPCGLIVSLPAKCNSCSRNPRGPANPPAAVYRLLYPLTGKFQLP